MAARSLYVRYQFHLLCQAALEVFTHWWQLRTQAIDTMRRCATAYLVRLKVSRRVQKVWLWVHHWQEWAPTPEEMTWYLAHLMPRFHRVCSVRLARIRSAKARLSLDVNDASAHDRMIAKLEALCKWSLDLQSDLSMLPVPDEVVWVLASHMFD